MLLALLALLFLMTPFVAWSFGNNLQFQPAVMVLVLAACFVLAGAGVLFAGEVEDGTVGLLKQLPIRPRDLMFAKFGVLLMAGGTYILAAMLIAMLGDAALGNLMESGLWRSTGVDAVYFRSLVGCLAWGTFFSLRRDRVLSAIGWGISLELLTLGLIGNVIADQRPEWRAPLHWGVTGCVLAVGLWLAWQWSSGSVATQKPGFSEETRFLVRPLATAQDRLARCWLNGLIYFASAGTPLRRWVGVVVWRELRTVIPALLIWTLCGVATIAIVMAGGSRVFGGFMWGWSCATPLLAGLMIAHGERRGESATFLACHGVSPAAFWWLRQLLWGGAALLLLALGWIVVSLGLGSDFILGQLIRLVDVYYRRAYFATHHIPSELVFDAISLTASLFLALFAFGQMCGLWFRSVLVSTLTAILLAVGILMWWTAILRLEAPPLLTTWPIALLWLYASRRQLPGWLIGDRSRPTLLRRAVWTIAPPLLSVALFSLARRFEITQVPHILDRRAPSSLVQSEANQVFVAAVDLLPAEIPTTGGITQEQLPQYRSRVAEFSQGANVDHASLDQLVRLLESDRLIQQYRREGRLDEEFELHLKALAASRASTMLSKNCWQYMSSFPVEAICRRIAGWANDERQSAERLEQAIPLLEAEFSAPIDLQPMVTAWEQRMLEAIDTGRPLDYDGPWELLPEERVGRALLSLLNEPERQRRLVHRIAESVPRLFNGNRLPDGPALVEFYGGDGTVRLSFSGTDADQLERWGNTSLGALMPYLHGGAQDFADIADSITEVRTAESACLQIVALQAYRLRHGQFPNDVTELLDGPLTALSTYGPRGSLFEFRSDGYSQPVVLSQSEVLPAGQPLLTVRSDFDFGRFYKVSNDWDADGQADISPDEAILSAIQANASNLSPDVARQLSAAYHDLHPTRIAFIEPRGTTYVKSWFCPSDHQLKEGRYVEQHEK